MSTAPLALRASSSTVTIDADVYNIQGSGGIVANTSGAVLFDSFGAAFTGGAAFSRITVGDSSTVPTFTLGRPTNTPSTGNITVSAGSIRTVNSFTPVAYDLLMGASVTVTGASSVVTLTAHDDLTPRASITAPGGISLLAKRAISDSTSATRVFTVSGSGNPILFAADTDNTGGGNIYLVGTNTFTTSGGAITFGGASATATSYATGYANSSAAGGGVVFNGAVTMTSAGGDITLRGQSTVSTNADGWYGFGVGFVNGNASLNSGSGKIYIDGKTRINAGNT
jgi:hypothetical protein